MFFRILFLGLVFFHHVTCLIPPKFQWKVIDFAWKSNTAKNEATSSGEYIPQNNLPTGIARWNDKLFITIPRWKKGVPSSLNYVYLNGSQNPPLNPYPSWKDAYLTKENGSPPSNNTVVSTFKVHVDKCNRLWVMDNGVADIDDGQKRIAEPALLVFDLDSDSLIVKYELEPSLTRDNSVFSNVVVDMGKGCNHTFVYILDMGSNAIVVYSLQANEAWRVEHDYFRPDPNAEDFRVGGVEFTCEDGVSAAALGPSKRDGSRNLYLTPTSSTKLFKISTKLLRDSSPLNEAMVKGVEVVGDKGPKKQSTACAMDPSTNVMFFTEVNKNGVGCWNTNKPFDTENTPLIISDCNLLEFPSDIKVDDNGNLWILSNKQSRFLHDIMDFNTVNFRVLEAPVFNMINGTHCEPLTSLQSLQLYYQSQINW